jgi:hypothetical protein
MTKFTLRALQEEQRPWIKHNFGDRPSVYPLLGICEELGELTEAFIKLTEAPIMSSRILETYDAIADTIIFAADYCSAMDWSVQEIWESRSEPQIYAETDEYPHVLFVCVGRMQHHYLKAAQNIRGSKKIHTFNSKVWLGHLLWTLERVHSRVDHLQYRLYQRSTGSNVEENVFKTVEMVWNRVKKRDWTKTRKS